MTLEELQAKIEALEDEKDSIHSSWVLGDETTNFQTETAWAT